MFVLHTSVTVSAGSEYVNLTSRADKHVIAQPHWLTKEFIYKISMTSSAHNTILQLLLCEIIQSSFSDDHIGRKLWCRRCHVKDSGNIHLLRLLVPLFIKKMGNQGSCETAWSSQDLQTQRMQKQRSQSYNETQIYSWHPIWMMN